MKVHDLRSALSVVSLISNPSSLAHVYKAVEFSRDRIRACSEFGNLEIAFEIGLDEPVLLDCEAIDAVVGSLPEDAEIFFSGEDNKVYWNTDDGAGYWEVVEQEDMTIPPLTHNHHPWSPPNSFAEALLFTSSLVTAATMSFELYGLVIEPDGELLRVASTNAISHALAVVPGEDYPMEERITLRPPIPATLASLLRLYPDSLLDVTVGGIYVINDQLRCQLPVSPPLDRDLFAIVDEYSSTKITARIDAVAVKRFLSRAKALDTDSLVDLKVQRGTLILRHKVRSETLILQRKSTGAGAEEYLLLDGLDPSLTFSSASFVVEQMIIPLENVDLVALDYLSENTLILMGEEPTFHFIICG